MATKICPNCGAEVDVNRRFCPACGEALAGNFRPVVTSKDPAANQKYTQEDIINRNKEIEKGRKETEKKQRKFEREATKGDRRQRFFLLSLISVICVVVGIVFCFTVDKGNVEWANNLFDVTFKQASSDLWNSMVKEFFTFLAWLICIMGMFIGFIFAFLVAAMLGPSIIVIGVVCAAVQTTINKKWWSVGALIFSLACLLTFSLIYFTTVL